MHRCLTVDEILRLFAHELVASETRATAVALACCRKRFEDPVLDALWEAQNRLIPLLRCLPPDVWNDEGGIIHPKRIPTKAEWAHSRKYARRMRTLTVDVSKDPVSWDILLAVQLRTVNDSWLPRLKTLECTGVVLDFIPFIPLFLSPQIIDIDIGFSGGCPATAVAPVISGLSTLCPNLERITLNHLSRDSIITEAASEMLLACNQDILEAFRVDSPLTEEAREVLYRLPKLSELWTVIQGPTPLPPVALPNLAVIDLEYDDDLSWLQGFRGATLEKLESAFFHSDSNHIGDFLEAFKTVVLTTSAQDTLSLLKLYTSRSWNPDYSALLSFNRLEALEIDFSCHDGCSSRLDDDMIMSLARAMPRLEVLQLGGQPCGAPTGVTVKGLIGLACRCPHLSKLCIHFQATSLVGAVTNTAVPSSSNKPVVWREESTLTDLDVGNIPIPAQSAFTIALTLLQIFPRILNVEYVNPEWGIVEESIKNFRRIGAFVDHSRTELM